MPKYLTTQATFFEYVSDFSFLFDQTTTLASLRISKWQSLTSTYKVKHSRIARIITSVPISISNVKLELESEIILTYFISTICLWQYQWNYWTYVILHPLIMHFCLPCKDYVTSCGWGRTMNMPPQAARCSPAPAHTRLTHGLRRPARLASSSCWHHEYSWCMQQRDVRRASSLNAPTLGAGHNKRIKGFTLLLTLFWLTGIFHRKEIYFVKK